MLNKVLNKYKTSEIYVCTLPQCERNNPSGEFPEINGNGDSLLAFNKAIVELAAAFGVKVLDHNKCGLTYQNMSVYNPNTLHPNAKGHSLIANNDIRQLDNFVRYRYNVL
jgi:lysophospholipase L1-like esterase